MCRRGVNIGKLLRLITAVTNFDIYSTFYTYIPKKGTIYVLRCILVYHRSEAKQKIMLFR